LSSKKNLNGADPDPVLFKVLHRLLELERDTEKLKVALSLKCDYNLIDAFRILDPNGQGYISVFDL
jgi:hypothetical protein